MAEHVPSGEILEILLQATSYSNSTRDFAADFELDKMLPEPPSSPGQLDYWDVIAINLIPKTLRLDDGEHQQTYRKILDFFREPEQNIAEGDLRSLTEAMAAEQGLPATAADQFHPVKQRLGERSPLPELAELVSAFRGEGDLVFSSKTELGRILNDYIPEIKDILANSPARLKANNVKKWAREGYIPIGEIPPQGFVIRLSRLNSEVVDRLLEAGLVGRPGRERDDSILRKMLERMGRVPPEQGTTTGGAITMTDGSPVVAEQPDAQQLGQAKFQEQGTERS